MRVRIDCILFSRRKIMPEPPENLQCSMQVLGLQVPLSVVEIAEKPGLYWLIDGHQRLLAARMLGWKMVDVTVAQL